MVIGKGYVRDRAIDRHTVRFEIRLIEIRRVEIFGEMKSNQRWSPRGHGLGLEAPRGQLVMSLALALASENMYLLLIIFALCA